MRIILLDAGFSPVIENLNIQITENGIYTVVGAPKSGKTTLLNGISGLIPASSGVILVGNFSPNWTVYHNLISFWRGSEYFYPKMTGFEHLKLLAKSQKRSLQTVFDASNDLKMINYIDRPVKVYPPGIQTRFDLALSSVEDKPLVLLDEPFTDIDEDSRVIACSFLSKMAQNRTIIITANQPVDAVDPTKIITLP
ncbi:ATP-binding cassette domain-containing protein [Xylocopilactobacillus apicola]|uniref:ABC transporter domain-containing protein n=1 Tax=Xylocopilactobacillus apicola TaxID=2932184 RepID=A0AAU9DLZ0_9LACO|nr:ATP-binding cassette domain-containing protein [Xylocopilactobacillus apicola]BDR57897.1 hypothetical protein XA3_03380 [Xylocopilactobacillus apicola]